MKKIILFALLGIGILSAEAQKVRWHKFSFEYMQPPLRPLSKNTESYIGKVDVSYRDVIAGMEAEHKAQVKIARERYDNDMKAYNKQSTAQKIINKEVIGQQVPVYQEPVKPFIPSIPNLEVLEKKYVVLEGYKKGTSNPAFITVTIDEMELIGPTMSVKQRNVTNNGVTTAVNYNSYYIQYKQPIHLKVESYEDKVLMDEIVPGTEQFNGRSYENELPPNYYQTLEENCINNNMAEMQYFLNENFGKQKKSLGSEITFAEGKKHDYSDLNQALEYALSGYNMLSTDKNGAFKKLQASVGIWENALKQFQPANKKARINQKVGVAIMMNISEACVFLEEFGKAEQYFSKASVNNPTSAQQGRIAYFRNFMKDYKARFDAQ